MEGDEITLLPDGGRVIVREIPLSVGQRWRPGYAVPPQPPTANVVVYGLDGSEFSEANAALAHWGLLQNANFTRSWESTRPSISEWGSLPLDLARAFAFWLANPGVRDVPLATYLAASGWLPPDKKKAAAG